jgi:hypothetical protein
MFPWDPFDASGGAAARLKSFRIYWGVTASTSGIIFIILLFFIADDLEDGLLKKLILWLRPPFDVFRKRKGAKQKRQDSMKKDSDQSSTPVANGSIARPAIKPEVPETGLRGGYLRHTLLRVRRNQGAESLA